MLIVLVSLVFFSLASALGPKSIASWPVKAEWILLPPPPSPIYGDHDPNAAIVPTLRLIPMTSMVIEEVHALKGDYIKEGTAVMSVVVWNPSDEKPMLVDVLAPVSGRVTGVYVHEKEVLSEVKPLMDIVEQKVHPQPIPLQPEPVNYGRQPSNNGRQYGRNQGYARDDRSEESTDYLNMLP